MDESSKAGAGQLGLKPRVRRCLRAAGDDALFRAIVVRVTKAWWAKFLRPRLKIEAGMTYSVISTIHIETGPGFPDLASLGSFDMSPRAEQAAAPIRAAVRFAEKQRAGDGFKGYTLHDLEAIGRVFSVE